MAEDARTRVLNAAGPIFAERGFQAATVREICRAAAVNVASVNYYFGDKETLYIETVRRAHAQRVQQFPLPKRPAGTPPAVRLRDFVHNLLTRCMAVEEAPWQVRLMMREILQPTAACRELVEEYFRPHFDILLGIVGELVGELVGPDVARHTLRQIGYSVVGQCLYYRIAREIVVILTPDEELREHYAVEQLADHITRMTLAAVRQVPSAAYFPSLEESHEVS